MTNLTSAPKIGYKVSYDGNAHGRFFVSINFYHVSKDGGGSDYLSFEKIFELKFQSAPSSDGDSSHLTQIAPWKPGDFSASDYNPLVEWWSHEFHIGPSPYCAVENMAIATRILKRFEKIANGNDVIYEQRDEFVKVLDTLDCYRSLIPFHRSDSGDVKSTSARQAAIQAQWDR